MPSIVSQAQNLSSKKMSSNTDGIVKRTNENHEKCCNPFRIPRHDVSAHLRNVPDLVRDRLAHVSFGRKICNMCRKRVYVMLKERKQLKAPSTRSENNKIDKRRSLPTSNNNARSTSEIPATTRRRTEIVNSIAPTATITTTLTTPIPTATLTVSTSPKASTVPTSTTSAEPMTSTASTVSTISTASTTLTSAKITMTSVAEEKLKPIPKEVTASEVVETLMILSTTVQDMSQVETSSRHSSLSGRSSISNLTDNSNSLSDHTMARRSKSQLQPATNMTPTRQICCFCGTSEENELEFGKFYEHSGIVTHYYCLLLSSNMEQKGNDDEGILGFLADDIHKEIKRGKRLVCSYCRKNGATLGCCNIKCKRIFHFPCGLKAGSLHQFFGEFRSYCINHRPRQKIDERVKKEVEYMSNMLCYICYEDVQPLDSNGTLWAPCCQKNAWFHRRCVQQLAMSAGYFFKCPLCNNKREFQTAMLEYGIYIPRQDASWELVPNAFEELLYRHDRCDAKSCLCPKGRTYTSNNAKWELALCRLCGSQGTHLFCSRLKWADPVWECQECISITNKTAENVITDNSTSNSNNITRNHENFQEDSDSDISVGNESLPVESNLSNSSTSLPQIKLRPGPRSFKLQQVQKLKSVESIKEHINSNDSSSNSTLIVNNRNQSSSNSAACTKLTGDIICLDSDDEAVEILCESVMKRAIKNNAVNRLKNIQEAGSSEPPKLLDLILQNASDETEESPFNIIISNVTSVPPEFFASVPETPDESEITPEPLSELPRMLCTSNNLKRNYPYEEEHYQSLIEATKRARLEDSNYRVNDVGLTSASGHDGGNIVKIAAVKSIHSMLSDKEQSSSKAATSILTGFTGETSSLENCHGNAGTCPAVVDTRRSQEQSNSFIRTTATALGSNQVSIVESTSPTIVTNTGTSSKFGIRTIFESGPTAYCSSGSSSSESSKSGNSCSYRAGLIPDYIYLSDLKFKICGNNLELTYGACKIQMKMNDMQSSQMLESTNNVTSASASSFAGSNQNFSSDKSSKSFQLRSEDSDGSNRNSKSLRDRSLKNFVYEDDNTLLEYPTSVSNSQNNIKLIKKPISTFDKNPSIIDRSDLKENWDPEISSSSNNTFENSNNNVVNSLDLRDIDVYSHEKFNKNDDSGFLQLQNENATQCFLRRSNRIVRYFRSVQETNLKLNGHLSGDFTDCKTNNLFLPSYEKSNQMTISSKSVRSFKSPKILYSTKITEEDKHLENVNINNVRFPFINKINGTRGNNEFDGNIDFKISIDLQKIENLINAKPDLFFKTKNNGVRRLRVYRVDEKLKVKLKSGEEKLLTKSQSFDCLLDLTKDEISSFRSMSKSLDNLLRFDSNDLKSISDRKGYTEKKIRRSQRRKTKQFEKHECVR